MIPDEDWEKGPGHIAGLISEIEARYDRVDLYREELRTQAERLQDKSGITRFLCLIAADEIEVAVCINVLPEEFDRLRVFPARLRLIAELATARERIEELESEVEALVADVAQLTRDLEGAKGKSRTDLFVDGVVSTSATVLTTGFWGVIAATVSHVTGVVDVGDLLSRFTSAAEGLPLSGPSDPPPIANAPIDV